MNKRSMKVPVPRRTLMFAALVMAVAVAATPRSAEAAKATCMDGTWEAYNECLMEARWEVQKKICDVQFYVDVYDCARELIAQ